MSGIDWASAASGDFHDASNWLGGIVPNSSQTAIIDATGPDFTVSVSGSAKILALTIGSNATLDILDHDFDDLTGGSNAGLIDLAPGSATFEAAGVLDNSGVIELDQQLGGSSSSRLIVEGAGLTLEGGGKVFLDNPNVWTNSNIPASPGLSQDFIAAHVSATLTNVDNTIYGAGQIGQGPLRVVNEIGGVIDADLTFDLNMKDVDGGIENDGLIESTGSGGLYIVSSTVDQGPGGVIAGNGGIVYVSWSDIVGGTLSSSGSGRFYWDHGETTLDGTQGGLTNDAFLFVSHGSQLGLAGAITNNDEFEIGSGQATGTVLVASAGVTLSGAGEIVLGGGNPATAIEAASSGALLTNLGNTIEGQGVIGGDGLIFDNSGTVDANARNPLSIVGQVTNSGLFEGTGFGGLIISAGIDNADGTILADTRVTLDHGSVSGGTVSVSGSLTFVGVDSVDAAIVGPGRLIEASGVAVLTDAGGFTGPIMLEGGSLNMTDAAPSGRVTFAGPAALEIGAALAPGSTLPTTLSDFDADGDVLDLDEVAFVVGATAALKGGVLTLSDGGEVYKFILRGNAASAFEVTSDGQGGTLIKADPGVSVGENNWASAVGGDFEDPADWAAGVVPNNLQAAILATTGPDLTVSSSRAELVSAVSIGANVTLNVVGSDFESLTGGSNAGLIDVAPGNATFDAAGVLDNSGVISLDQQLGGAAGAMLVVDSGGLTLEGGGKVFLNNPNVWTNSDVPAPPGLSTDFITTGVRTTLTNVDNTIYGAGQIGQGPLRIVNGSGGVIDANLTFDLNMQAIGGGIQNDGLMESTGSGGLYVVSTTVDQGPGGVIGANGGIVYFSWADIVGGTLSASGSGHFYWDHGETTLDGTQGGVTIDAYVFVSDGAQLGLEGAIANDDEIEAGTGVEASAVLIDAAGVTLSGGGEIVLGGRNQATAIEAASSGAVLTNVDNTLEGQGVIGGDGLILVNKGTVNASAQLPLAITGQVTNDGLLEATGVGGLSIAADVDNSDGTILADTGVTIDGATISGGALTVAGSLTLSGADNVSAAITGAGRLIESDGEAMLANAGGFSGSITLESGTLEITAAAPTGSVTFAGPATLEIGEALAPGSTLPNKLVDFDASGDALDLAGVWFVAGATVVLNGSVLTLSDGGEVYKFVLRGSIGATFGVTSDGQGGTLIKADPDTGDARESAIASNDPSVDHPAHEARSGAGGHAGESHEQYLVDTTAGMADLDEWLSGHVHSIQIAQLGSDWGFH